MRWPTWMDEAGLLGKSSENEGDSLARHTWLVLSQMAGQMRRRPELASLAGERVWNWVYWACFLHDFGKAAREFQDVLRHQENEWSQRHQRHEALSLGFVDWLFPKGHQAGL